MYRNYFAAYMGCSSSLPARSLLCNGRDRGHEQCSGTGPPCHRCETCEILVDCNVVPYGKDSRLWSYLVEQVTGWPLSGLLHYELEFWDFINLVQDLVMGRRRALFGEAVASRTNLDQRPAHSHLFDGPLDSLDSHLQNRMQDYSRVRKGQRRAEKTMWTALWRQSQDHNALLPCNSSIRIDRFLI